MHILQQKLQTYSIILGSQSPRRKELLQGLDLPFTVRVKDTDESYDSKIPNEKVPQILAEKKFNAFIPELQENEFLITADTVVILGNEILHKPQNLDEAHVLIQKLSGATHTVVTGVCIGTKHSKKSFSDFTKVTFDTISKENIAYYVNSYKPMDKAGAYGVQEWIGYMGIEKIEGSYYNVMGLPVHVLYKHLVAFEL